jgi:hypothetical protein
MALLGTGAFYNKSHGIFLKKTDQVTQNKEVLNLHLPSAVRKILQQTQERLHFNILSGDGEIDQHIVKIIKEELQSYEKYQHIHSCNRAQRSLY